MSYLSGKCDLLDYIAHGNDLLECFEEFKKKTNGVIYQHHCFKSVSKLNHNLIAKLNPNFVIVEHTSKVEDKRTKNGFKTNTYYTYKYFDKEYTSKEISKKGVYAEVPIKFNTILDLLPYLPYIVSASYCNENCYHIIISNDSYVETHFKEGLDCGVNFDVIQEVHYMYRKDLSKMYINIIKNYYLHDLEKRTRELSLSKDIVRYDDVNDYYYVLTNESVDYMWDIQYKFDDNSTNYVYYESPILSDDLFGGGRKIVILNKHDVEHYLKDDINNGCVKIRYVVKESSLNGR